MIFCSSFENEIFLENNFSVFTEENEDVFETGKVWTKVDFRHLTLSGTYMAEKVRIDRHITSQMKSSTLELANNFLGNGRGDENVDTLDNLASLKVIELNLAAVNVWLSFLRICQSFKINSTLYLPYSVTR